MPHRGRMIRRSGLSDVRKLESSHTSVTGTVAASLECALRSLSHNESISLAASEIDGNWSVECIFYGV
jgi:predicted secreted Zn-dependent protease